MEKSHQRGWSAWEGVGVLIVIVLLIGLCSRPAPAQSVVSIVHHPVDFGIGIRADIYPGKDSKALFKRLGSYSAVSYGNWGLYKRFGIKHHTTITSGILIPLKSSNSWLYNFSIGANYHHLGKGYEVHPMVDPNLYKSWSYELGLSVSMKHVAVCMATDMRRWEPSIGLGFLF